MIFKYYTANLVTLFGEELETPSITVKVWIWNNPVQVIAMMKNQLESWGFQNHRIQTLRRIK